MSSANQSKFKHTPGPWAWDENIFVLRPVVPDPAHSAVHTILTRDYGSYGYIDSDVKQTEAELKHDFGLIAAAPCLFHSLKLAEEFIRGFEDDELQEGVSVLLAIIRDTLAKVETPHD